MRSDPLVGDPLGPNDDGAAPVLGRDTEISLLVTFN